ncbi:hypothetical protein ACHAQF_006541 [Verticillium nonalfalfae]
MTEPENFEDDLFADLYDDDAAPSKPAAAAPPTIASVPAPVVEPAPPAPAYNEAHNEAPVQINQDEPADNQIAYDDDDDDDDVDFNLGGGAPAPPPPPPANGFSHHEETSYSGRGSAKNPSAKEDGKMFIGGLNWETTDQSLRDYFAQFGEVVECTVMRDSTTGRSRGFGFLTFKDAKTVNIVMVKEHFLDGKIIDPKRAIPRDEQEKTSKIFVGGVSQETTDQEFKDYFAQFGRVVDATLMMDKDTGRPRGFGFVTFESEEGVDACLKTHLEIHGKPIEVKKAQPRGNLREEEEAARRGGGKFRKGGDDGGTNGQGGMNNQMGGAGGMTPQGMAQHFQRMQQYFAMMQQQMAMQRGMPMNPAMMQQMMQMQQMQQMQNQMMGGRGGGGPNGQNPQAMMNNMNPAMMQQMQQMQQQQQQMMSGGGGGGGGSDGGQGSPAPEQQQAQGGGDGFNNNNNNNNNFNNQQQQMFNQQQQQGPRGGGQKAYGGFGMGGGPGGPTSWEGMYDDVPQPNIPQGPSGGRGGGFHRGGRGGFQHQQQPVDPNHAPPANAPTGPKNAGRPGANYRGGGRGNNRGFHPYSRG